MFESVSSRSFGTSQQAAVAFFALAALFCALAWGVTHGLYPRLYGGDIGNIYLVSQSMMTDWGLYEWKLNLNYYLPSAIVLYHPLTFLSLDAARLVWEGLSILASLGCFLLCLQCCRLPLAAARSWVIMMVALCCFASPIADNIYFGNNTPMLVLAALLSQRLLMSENPRTKSAAFLLALGLAVKTILLPLLVYWAWRGHWRAVAWTLGFSLLFLALPLGVFGWEKYSANLAIWYAESSKTDHTWMSALWAVPLKLAGQLENLTSGVSLKFFFPWFEFFPWSMQRPLTIPTWALYGVYGSMIFLVLFTLVILRTPSQEPQNRFAETAYIMLVIPFIAPVQHYHSLLFAMPALVWVLQGFLEKPRRSHSSFMVVWATATLLLMATANLLPPLLWQFLDDPVNLTSIRLIHAASILLLIPVIVHLQNARLCRR